MSKVAADSIGSGGGGWRVFSYALRAWPLARPLHLVLIGFGVAVVGKGGLLLVEVDAQRRGHEAPTADLAPISRMADGNTLPEPAAGPDDHVAEAPYASGGPAPQASSLIDLSTIHFTPRELELLGRLAERRESLEERERVLDLREAVLDDAEAQLAARVAELQALKRSIEEIVQQHDTKEETKLASLVKIYEAMKPKSAAEIFDRLQMEVLIEVVARMREAKSSDVIGRMDPERARQLTAALAERRKLPVSIPAEREAAD